MPPSDSPSSPSPISRGPTSQGPICKEPISIRPTLRELISRGPPLKVPISRELKPVDASGVLASLFLGSRHFMETKIICHQESKQCYLSIPFQTFPTEKWGKGSIASCGFSQLNSFFDQITVVGHIQCVH